MGDTAARCLGLGCSFVVVGGGARADARGVVRCEAAVSRRDGRAGGRGPVVEVAERYGISRKTVHVWLRRYRDGGLVALADRSQEHATDDSLLLGWLTRTRAPVGPTVDGARTEAGLDDAAPAASATPRDRGVRPVPDAVPRHRPLEGGQGQPVLLLNPHHRHRQACSRCWARCPSTAPVAPGVATDTSSEQGRSGIHSFGEKSVGCLPIPEAVAASEPDTPVSPTVDGWLARPLRNSPDDHDVLAQPEREKHLVSTPLRG